MNIIKTIKTEVERRYNEMLKRAKITDPDYWNGKADAYRDLLSFIDTLEEDRLEPYTGVYDEAYLNEKIAKATKSWKGVDVDAMLAECRGYEEKSEKPTNLDLKKEIDSCWQSWLSPSNQSSVEGILPKTEFAMYARHFAEWGAEHLKK